MTNNETRTLRIHALEAKLIVNSYLGLSSHRIQIRLISDALLFTPHHYSLLPLKIDRVKLEQTLFSVKTGDILHNHQKSKILDLGWDSEM